MFVLLGQLPVDDRPRKRADIGTNVFRRDRVLGKPDSARRSQRLSDLGLFAADEKDPRGRRGHTLDVSEKVGARAAAVVRRSALVEAIND